ncbi:MAG: dihydrolipoyl dehydrogenase [Candidatus Aquicultor sp.]
MERYEIAIIGSGPAGYVGAVTAARAGVPVCIIEKGDFGGVCLNTGCIPTKTLVASAKALRNARRAGEYGIDIGDTIQTSLEKLQTRKDRVVDIEKQGLFKLVEKNDVQILKGHASFNDINTLKISGADGEQTIFSKNIIIATGSKPHALPFLAYDGVKVLSSDDLLRLTKLPDSMLIIGGGYIGCEFASIFSALGTKITIIEALPRLLMNTDEEVSAILAREFKKAGIDVRTNSTLVGTRVDDKVEATIEDGTVFTADIALVAIGRLPSTGGIGHEKIGLETLPNGGIKVNNQMMTNIPGIYAVGDVIGNPMLAHVASAECKVAVANALGNRYMMDYTVIPSGIYTYPEIGSVGITEGQAKDMGMDVKVGSVELRSLGISHASGEIAGKAKIIADAISDRIVGVHVIGERATDIIHEVAVAMYQGMTASALGMVIHAHPTFSELIYEAALDVNGNAIYMQRLAA